MSEQVDNLKASALGNKEQGEIKWYNAVKGFGFIAQNNSENGLFVHASNIENTEPYVPIDDGHKVSFEIGENDKGLYAKNVTLL